VVSTLKENLINMLMSLPPKVSSQFQEAVYFLTVRELPYRWPTLPQVEFNLFSSFNS
jgi:hypothetical protein